MADDAVPELAVPVVLNRGQSIDRCWVDKFSPVTAKYLKVKILSTWSGFPHPWVYQWQLLGALQ